MKITRKQFIQTIEALERQNRHDSKCSDALEKVFPDSEIILYDNSRIVSQTIKLLEELTNDKNEWIQYFIFEKDFGKNYKAGDVFDEEGKEIPLAKKTDLWRLLNKG